MQKNQKKLNDLSLDKRQEFGRYVVIQRRIMLCQQELQWCQQVREQMQPFTKRTIQLTKKNDPKDRQEPIVRIVFLSRTALKGL